MQRPKDYGELSNNLWDKTGVDWHAVVSLGLTEPVCATVSISSDDETLPRVDGFIGTADANESIALAIEYLMRNLDGFYEENPDMKPKSLG